MKIISPEQRRMISESMKKVHAAGKHSGWAFINHDKKRRSYPEKYFIQKLKEYKISTTYKVKEKLPYSKYTLDFVIVKLKINIEIDGQQHFRTKEALEHDHKRDQFMISEGWKVYRIAWKEIQTNSDEVMKNLLQWILDIGNNTSRYYNIEDLKFEKKIKRFHINIPKYKFFVTKEELEELLSKLPMTKIGEMFNVSDNAVKKRAMQLGIVLGNRRQYSAKLAANK